MGTNRKNSQDNPDLPLARIKRIAIELKDYSFYHSPYQAKYHDKRFIGRRKKMQQFKSVLNDTVTDSGTYLVTGYRGSGKTSFVNIVLEQIAATWRFSDRTRILLRNGLLLVIFLLIFSYLNSTSIPWYFLSISIPVIWALLFYFDQRRSIYLLRGKKGLVALNWKNCNFFFDFFKHLLRTGFYIERHTKINNILQNIGRMLLSMSVFLTLVTFISSNTNVRFNNTTFQICCITFILVIYWLILRIFDWYKNTKSKKVTVVNLINELKSRLKPKLIINLNLNYGNLTERNILQLMANSLYDQYRKWRSTPFQILLRFFMVFILWIITSIFYQNFVKDYLYDLKKVQIFQNSILTNDLKILSEKVDAIYLKIRKKIIETMQEVIFFHWIDKKFLSFGQLIYPMNFEPLLYLGFLIELMTFWLCQCKLRIFPGHARVLGRLKDLNERIVAATTIQSGVDVRPPNGLAGWLRQKSLHYPLADERTIEQSIIQVLREISRLPNFLGHPSVIFVFDELDKITLSEETAKSGSEETLYLSSFENIRRRQQQVEKILSNLKQLLTTADAKFIFIAGREMYDAGLADFTSRSFLHSSIFNQTFYVDSFLTDHSDPKEKSLTSLVESYICQFLLPPRMKPWPKLTDFLDHLEKSYKIAFEKKQKIEQVLHDFVSYLTYRGNGSPKKITQLFESFIRPLPDDIKGKKTNEEWLIIGSNHKSLYLVFNYTQQFVLGATTRLLEPLHHTIERTASLYNDKLATSIFMVLDHLFKFHRSAFRLDFLELMPEILDIYRDPDLRNIIQEMLGLLESTYLDKVHNGVFDYRFTNRIRGELDFASRISDLESAVFNFTLDESVEVEQFFRRQLKDQLKNYQDENNKKANQAPNPTGRLHEIIGDLHAFDEEYDQAITEYANALHRLELW